MVGEQEAVPEVRTDGMLDHQLPQHGTQSFGEVLGEVVVFLRRCNMQDSADADQYAARPGVFHERDLLGVEETERSFWLDVGAETLQQRLLIFLTLHPRFGCLETEVGLTTLVNGVNVVRFCKFREVFPQHPVEWNGRR